MGIISWLFRKREAKQELTKEQKISKKLFEKLASELYHMKGILGNIENKLNSESDIDKIEYLVKKTRDDLDNILGQFIYLTNEHKVNLSALFRENKIMLKRIEKEVKNKLIISKAA